MRDPTWRCAVMTSATPRPPAAGRLPRDRRGASRRADRRARALGIGHAAPSARRGTSRARGVPSPSPTSRSAIDWGRSSMPRGKDGWTRRPAEIALLTLVGQHAGTALEHSLLYAQVRQQADELNRLAGVQADFLRGVTHDLQTPLTSIAALATELRAAPDQSAETRGRPRLDRPPGRATAPDGEPAARRLAPGRRRVHPSAGGLRGRPRRRADVGRAPGRSSLRARRHRARRTWPSPTRTDWSRSCGPCSTTRSSTARRGRRCMPGSTRRTGCWPSRFATAARGWTPRPASSAFEQFYRSDAARRPGSRRERGRPLCGERPDAGDGRSDRDHEPRGRGDRGDAARSGRAERRRDRLGPPYQGGTGSPLGPCKVTCKVSPIHSGSVTR